MLTEILLAAGAETANPSGATSLALSFAGALAGSAVTAAVALRRDKKSRKAESQKMALYDLQDSAIEYENVLREVVDGLITPPQVLALDMAKARLDATVDRVDSSVMQSRCDAWRQEAEWYYLEADEGTQHGLQDAWAKLRRTIAYELRQRDA